MRFFSALPMAIGIGLVLSASPASAQGPAVGKPAPPFALADVNEKQRSLSEFRGRRVALFFFCGCSWCEDVAREWAALQRGGALAEKEKGKGAPAPATLIVYSELDAPVARELSSLYGLDPAQSVSLPDPAMAATKVYRADPCPRVFVLDGKGVLRYTNDRADDAPRKAPALVITSRALEALRAAAPEAPKSTRGKK